MRRAVRGLSRTGPRLRIRGRDAGLPELEIALGYTGRRNGLAVPVRDLVEALRELVHDVVAR
ncbi:hypothetical protein M3640_20690, partial [Bacillus velezensis]|nr:hypothetical protein [Bacillus velezensis]